MCKKICTTKILTRNYYIITYSNWLYTDRWLFCSYILYDANSHIFCTKIELRHRFIGNFITTCTQTTGLNLENIQNPNFHIKDVSRFLLSSTNCLCLRASNHLARVGDDKVKSFEWSRERDNQANEEHHFWLILLDTTTLWDKNQHINTYYTQCPR